MTNTRRCGVLILCGAVALAFSVLLPGLRASATPSTDCAQADVPCEPMGGESPSPETVGTVVYVVIHKSFLATSNADQCVGAGALAAVQRGSSALLSEGSTSSDTRTVAVGVFIRSRVRDGMCEVLYIASAPVLPMFNVQFAGPTGESSVPFGPITAKPVTDQPGIQQALSVDMDFALDR